MELQENYNVSNAFDRIIQSLESEKMEQRDRGTLFELVTRSYLKNEPFYAQLYSEVWLLSEAPEEYSIPKVDTGVDLVALERLTGNLVAIQCKYYAQGTTIQKAHIDSFLNEVGKNYYASGVIISTTDKWSNHAENALHNRDKNIARIGLSQLRNSEIDWEKFKPEQTENITLRSPKMPRSHQVPAIEAVITGFEKANRGKLIMAPGTGKTYTSMVIAEEMAEKKEGTFRVLYLVPSIQLLSQSLRGWTADSKFRESMDTFAVCSDRQVTKKTTGNEFEDIAAADLGFPATTNYEKLLENQEIIESRDEQNKFMVVFSTYQSIDVIAEAQENGFYEFDLIVCDEAHRTTGATEQGQDESAFVKVHYNDNIKAEKRLYQTATPRVYGEDAKQKADEMSVVVADMDNPTLYGEEFYRIGFGEAVNKGILTDYKVMVLAVEEDAVAKSLQRMFSKNSDNELEFDDVTKIIGCWNGLVKRTSESNIISSKPMKRAIAFTGTIKESKLITEMFSDVVDMYINESGDQKTPVQVEIEHADGSMNALQKNEKIDWLKAEVPEKTCRILSNARFLTEGVDVPDLDAVMFLKPRRSKIDIAQAVGRVMRKSEGKEYGYVILPIGIPAGANANTVLDNNEKYKVVWDVLNALRSIDERFDATINKLELNKNKPDQIQVIGVGDAPEDSEGGFEIRDPQSEQLQFGLDEASFNEIEKAIYGKIVQKVGNVRYWEDWSKDVAEIARQHITSIKVMIEDEDSEAFKAFENFVKGLRHNINDAISETQAIEMLAQHIITKPVFEALFESYSFVKDNPVSRSMELVLDVMDKNGLLKEQEKLEDFYESVRIRAEGIDNLKAKQDIIIQLYDKFFKVAFKETTERLGIVFTPVEVVDFIIRSVDDVLKKHFGKSISDEGVHILDPFTGTGTFIVRLLQSGLVSKEDIVRKYSQELHANEIILLSYYIAAINIEETFHSIFEGNYKPFEGIVLTDTFESTETKDSFVSELFNENNKRLKKQQEESIFAILGNPPYSGGQISSNDNNPNKNYPMLDDLIKNSYVKYSDSNNKNYLYDSYIRSFKWSSERIKEKGIISFVTNSSYLDGRTMDGMRKCWHKEFNFIYIYNLRGDQRTSGEDSRKEGGKIFGSGSRAGIAIILLVKDGSNNHEIYYSDIGDYLTRKQKLSIIQETETMQNLTWKKIIPDLNNDWLNQREESFDQYISFISDEKSIFKTYSMGIQTKRDKWILNFNEQSTRENMTRMVDNYNSEVVRLKNVKNRDEKIRSINTHDSFIKWSDELKRKLVNNDIIELNENYTLCQYRPFTRKWLLYDKNVIARPGKFENWNTDNKIIYTTGVGGKKEFSTLMINHIPESALLENGRGFFFELNGSCDLISTVESNFSDEFLRKMEVSAEDAFYYIYGLLHSVEYRDKYKNNLKKGFPRIPILKNKKAFIEIGKQLADIHLNYESIKPYDEVVFDAKPNPSYKVKKMKHPKRGVINQIIYNTDIVIANIPEKAYEYVVNGKSAIQWVMDQYQVKTDKKSGITDDPNLYSDDEKYIFNLLLRIINLSVQTVDLVNSLPPLEIIEDEED